MTPKIPLIRPVAPRAEAAERHFSRAREAAWFSNFGVLHEEFSEKLKAVVNAKYVLPVASGTAAVEIALRSLGLDQDAGFDTVLVPDFTHVGTLLGVLRSGFNPIFAGVDDSSWTLRAEEVSSAHARGMIDAAVVVCPFGYGVNFSDWEQLSKRLSMPLVYDIAGGFGHFPKTAGPRCYSMHATKNFGFGEGGFIAFDDERQYRRARRLINFDILPDHQIASDGGSNAKMDELHAAYGLAALEEPFFSAVKERIKKKQIQAKQYCFNLRGASMPETIKYPSLCVVNLPYAKEILAAAESLPMVVRQYFPLLSRMPAFNHVFRVSQSSDRLLNCLALPSEVSAEESMEIIEAIRKYV